MLILCGFTLSTNKRSISSPTLDQNVKYSFLLARYTAILNPATLEMHRTGNFILAKSKLGNLDSPS